MKEYKKETQMIISKVPLYMLDSSRLALTGHCREYSYLLRFSCVYPPHVVSVTPGLKRLGDLDCFLRPFRMYFMIGSVDELLHTESLYTIFATNLAGPADRNLP